jgi:hypothetical protein
LAQRLRSEDEEKKYVFGVNPPEPKLPRFVVIFIKLLL